MDLVRELEVIGIHEPSLILALLRLAVLPLIAEILDLVDAVLLRVVVLAGAPHALPHRQMARVHGDAVVLGFPALAEVRPTAFLLLEIETGGVGEEEPGDEHACETEPGHEVELFLRVDVVVDHCCEEGAELAPGGGETVGGGSNGGRENFRGHEEGDCIGTKLVEEGGQEVHGLKGVDALDGFVVVVVERRDDEEDEVHEETELHHSLSSDQLVVDQEGGHVVTAEGDGDVDEVPEPAGHDVAGFSNGRIDGSNECGLEELVAVEENVVGEPGSGSSDEAGGEVLEGQLQGLDIISSDLGPLLRCVQLLGCERHLVGTVVDEPESADCGNGERDTERPLSRDQRIWRLPTVVEDEEKDDQDGLVEELTPTLHQEGHGHFTSTVETVLPRRDFARSGGVLHGGGSSHGVFSTNTDAVEHQGEGVADDPSV